MKYEKVKKWNGEPTKVSGQITPLIDLRDNL